MIAGCRADPFFRPPFYPLSGDIHTALLLFHNPLLSIALGVTGVDQLAAKKLAHGGEGSIAFSGLLTKFRYLKAGGATLSFWEAPIRSATISSPRRPARRASSSQRRLEDGEEIVIDGRRQSFVIEHAREDMVYFQAMVRPGGAPVTAEYDRETLAFLSASSTDEASSRIQMMVSLLRAMEREDALPLMEKELESPHFYTRWHVMREMLALDAEAALPALKRMAAGDPHPEVRAAASQTLALFFPDEAGRRMPRLIAADTEESWTLGRTGRACRDRRPRHARRGEFRQLRPGAEEARQQPDFPRRPDDRRAQGPLRRSGPRQPVQRPGRDAARQRIRLSDPRQFLAGDAGQRHPPQRHRSLPLPCAARPQFLVPDRRLSRLGLLERLLRI